MYFMVNELVKTIVERNIFTFVPILKNIGQTLRPLELKKRTKRVLGSRIVSHFMVPGDSEHDDDGHRKSSNLLRNFAKISCVAIDGTDA